MEEECIEFEAFKAARKMALKKNIMFNKYYGGKRFSSHR